MSTHLELNAPQRIALVFATLLSAISPAPGQSLATSEDRDPDKMSASVVSASVPGPAAPNTFVGANTGTCARSDVLVGGGALESGSTSNGLHLNGSAPANLSRNPVETTSPPTNWTATGATGDQAVTGAATTAFAMCLADGPKHLRVVENDTPGPAAANSSVRTTATCPTRFVVVGGGARTDPGTAGGLKPIGSFPSDAKGNPAANLTTDPTSWTAVELTGGQPAPGATTRAFAMCARARKISTQVVSLATTGPTTAGTSSTLTVSCPGRGATVLLGGGMVATGPGGGIPQTGVHLCGMFLSDSSGNPAIAGQASSFWTGVDQTGGQAAPGTTTRVFALCAQLHGGRDP